MSLDTNDVKDVPGGESCSAIDNNPFKINEKLIKHNLVLKVVCTDGDSNDKRENEWFYITSNMAESEYFTKWLEFPSSKTTINLFGSYEGIVCFFYIRNKTA